MSLMYVRDGYKFTECPACAAKPGMPELCHDCLERRELLGMAERLQRSSGLRTYIRELVTVCKECSGKPSPSCPEHGR